MKASFRFLKTAGGITRFATVTVDSTPSSRWDISMVALSPMLQQEYGEAIRHGIAMAVAEQERRDASQFRVTVAELVDTAVDTSNDAVECAAAIATWKSFGHEEGEILLTLELSRWVARFK